MSNIDDVQKYKKNSYIFLLIIITYIFIGQTLISYGLDKYSISNLFLGIPKLTIETNIIEIQLNNDAYKIGLHFETALKESIEPLDISIVDSSSEIDQKKDYEISLSSDRTWIHISSNNKTLSLRDKPIKILLSNKKGASRAIKRFIDKIRINDTDFTAKEVFIKYLSQTNNNLALYYPLEIKNLSNTLALKFGNQITFIITTTLMILLSFQLVFFFVSLYWQPEEVKKFFINPNQQGPATLIDGISENFSIPLGFLGTVTSIWIALENSETDYSSFSSILDIIKIAIFTTVLGLIIKILCIIRSKTAPYIR